jgi:hypothetical protein
MKRLGMTSSEASASITIAAPRLQCMAIHHDAPRLVPASASRDWMDDTNQRFAYRCIPLSIANASGWELLCPADFEASWSGGSAIDAITIRSLNDEARVSRFVVSHFGHGVLTMHPGYLFRTSPGWALWVRGSPNHAKRHIVPLDGLVETEWLDFTFTMNWRFTRIGTVRFEKDEPFCFLTPVPHAVLDGIEPEISMLDDHPAEKAAFAERSQSRRDFNANLAARDPDVVAQGWQRHYVKGESADGKTAGYHLSKRKLKAPRIVKSVKQT